MTDQPLTADALEARVFALQTKLTDAGHRTTPQRLHVLQALLATADHPTAEDVWERVRAVSPTTTLATVYKTLETLREMGEVMELATRDQSRHYDALRPNPHPHVVCKSCGRIADVALEDTCDFKSQASATTGYEIDEQVLTFYGQCKLCQTSK